jgi:hypothetical protein
MKDFKIKENKKKEVADILNVAYLITLKQATTFWRMGLSPSSRFEKGERKPSLMDPSEEAIHHH